MRIFFLQFIEDLTAVFVSLFVTSGILFSSALFSLVVLGLFYS